LNDTICAPATALGGALMIIRMSGPESVNILKKIFRSKEFAEGPESHRIYFGLLTEAETIIDEVLVSVMLAPRSFTGEDVIEISCHGGEAVYKKVLSALIENGARLAQPGEFTKRAFLNGRLDLSRAEAVMDIISSKSDTAHKMALNQLRGFVSREISNLREILLKLIANIEVSIDYPENDIEELTVSEIRAAAVFAASEIDSLIKGAESGIVLKDGLETVIIGRPNVGKSSLLNALLKYERAIVTDVPGTTRDVLSETASLDNGIILKLSDTAGIRNTDEAVEKIGVERSLLAAESAMLILAVFDGSEPLTEEDARVLDFVRDKNALVLINKCDKPRKLDIPGIEISATERFGLDKLEEAVKKLVLSDGFDLENPALISSLRHKEALINAKKSLSLAIETLDKGFGADLAVIDLEDAYRFLGEITGETISEDICDRIFSEFCVGK